MNPELTVFLEHYGYLAVFVLVFLPEIGIPNPVPIELILLFIGFLAFSGVLNFWLVFLAAVAGDFIGTTILYSIFYFFGHLFLEKKPRWIPISRAKIEKVSRLVSRRGVLGIYFGRLIPYLRGYVSVAAGLAQVRPKVFIPIVLFSAATWSGGFVIAGRLIGPEWQNLATNLSDIRNGILVIIASVVLIAVAWHYKKKHKHKK